MTVLGVTGGKARSDDYLVHLPIIAPVNGHRPGSAASCHKGREKMQRRDPAWQLIIRSPRRRGRVRAAARRRDSQDGRYGIFRRGGVDQSALMLASRITLPHFSVSSAISRPNSPDVIDIGSTPKLASRAFMMESAAMALISLLSLSITLAGVSFGAPTPYHWLAS